MQTIIFTGYLAKECEIVQGKDGEELIRFDVAARDGRDKEGKPTYYACRMKRTGIAEYLKKGRFVSVVGHFSAKVVNKEEKTFVNLDVRVINLELTPLPKED